MSDSQNLKTEKNTTEKNEKPLQKQEENIKMLIANIESQNLVLEKLSLAIEHSMQKTSEKNKIN